MKKLGVPQLVKISTLSNSQLYIKEVGKVMSVNYVGI